MAGRAPTQWPRQQRQLGIRDHGAAAAENERALCASERLGEILDRLRIGRMRPARRRPRVKQRQITGERRVLRVERHLNTTV